MVGLDTPVGATELSIESSSLVYHLPVEYSLLEQFPQNAFGYCTVLKHVGDQMDSFRGCLRGRQNAIHLIGASNRQAADVAQTPCAGLIPIHSRRKFFEFSMRSRGTTPSFKMF